MKKSKTVGLTLDNDKANQYRMLVHKIEGMINEIKGAGFDVLKYEELLRNIKKNTDQFSFQSVSKEILNNGKFVIDYNKSIEQLKSLEQLISLYDKYIKAVVKCRFVLSKLSRENTLEEIKYYSFMIIEVLKDIKGINNIVFSDEEDIVLEIYNIIYKVIKTELIIYDHSDLYDYIKNNQVDIYFINKFIKEEIDEIYMDTDDDEILRKKIFDIKNMGIDTNYFDLELIKLIIMNSDLEYRDRVTKKITGLRNNILDGRREIDNKYRLISEMNEDIIGRKNISSKIRERITVRISSIILTLSILVSGGVELFKLIKNNCYVPVYQKTTTYYSEYTDEVETFTEEIKSRSGFDDEVFVKVYGAWEENNKMSRTVKKYDLSDISLDSIYEYLEIELSLFHQTGNAQRYSYDLNDIDKYDTEYKTVEIVEYTDLNKDVLDVSGGIVVGVLGEIFYLMLIYLLYLFVSINYNRLDIKEILKSFSCSFETIRDNKRINMSDRERIVENLKELLDMIMKDDKLKEEFNRLFEENKYLINDLDTLIEKFDSVLLDIDSVNVKKLVKKYM